MSELNFMLDQVSNAFSEMVENYTRNKLPENLFVSNFLPFFCGKVDLQKNKDFIPTWVSIAGSPSAEVEIIDTKGNVIFVVPGLFDSSIIDPKKETKGYNFAEIVNLARMFGNMVPKMGQDVLKKELDDKIKKLSSKSELHKKNLDTWMFIFERYGVFKEEKQQQKDSTEKITKTSNVSDDDFE